ncbi:MAG: RNA polymerase sigma factor [Bacteroidia bacterium]|nr:RNA polymerase sigma factor [Bacteroidia bacterium]
MEEELLISKLKAGDQATFRAFFLEYQTMVYNVCLGFVPKVEDAEDLTQEVFFEVFRSIANFKGDAKLSTWLYRIAVTKSLELLRSRKRKKRSGFLVSISPGEDLGLGDESEINHPGMKMENKEKAAALFQALAELPDNQRTAFTLSQIEGLSYTEVCETMDLSKSSVESLIFRARKNLKKSLEWLYRE